MRRAAVSFMSPSVCPPSSLVEEIFPGRGARGRGKGRFERATPSRALARGLRPSSPPLRAGIGEWEAHMHAGACFALDDEELVAESRDDGEPYAESGAVIAGRHPHAVVGDEDPDALAVGRHADIDA